MADIATIIREAAARYGVDPAYLLRAAQIESRMNPGAANPSSSARGLFQFLTAPGKSWSQYGRGGDPLDPVANADAGARYTVDNMAALQKALGRAPTFGETYLAHQQGAGGAAALLRDPSAPAVSALAPLYKNPQTAADAIRLNGGAPGISAGDFAAKWTSKFAQNGVPVADVAAAPPVPGAEVPVSGGNPAQWGYPGGSETALGSIFASALAPLAQKPAEPAQEPKKALQIKKPNMRNVLDGLSENLVLA